MGEKINITEDGLVYKYIQTEGTGEIPKTGDKVSVHYLGTLESDGSKFDSSYDRNEPFEFTIGEGVIQGWSLGVATMKVGEKSEFHIAAKYGYGDHGSPPKIPGGATLVFVIELLDIVQSHDRDLQKAEVLNTEAAAAFRSQDFATAVSKYHEALHLVSHYYDEECRALQVKFNNNLATAHCKLGDWAEAISHADNVLNQDASNLKALVHKADAQIHLGKIADARATIQSGEKVDPSAFKTLKARLTAAEKENQKREDNLFKKMLGK